MTAEKILSKVLNVLEEADEWEVGIWAHSWIEKRHKLHPKDSLGLREAAELIYSNTPAFVMDQWNRKEEQNLRQRTQILIDKLRSTERSAKELNEKLNQAKRDLAKIQNELPTVEIPLQQADAFIESMVGKGISKRHTRTFLESMLGVNGIPTQGDLFGEGGQEATLQRLENLGRYLSNVGNTILTNVASRRTHVALERQNV
jgi:hypothetical protein